jgi:hemerythrin
VAKQGFSVHAYQMRKTSDIIWQDAQHQVLFQILDLVKQPGADRQVLHKLMEYIENHFALEEGYMEVLDYPGRDVHIEAHNLFRKEIKQLVGEGRDIDPQFMEVISTFLTEWLTRHVFGIDKELEAFILESDVK